MTEGLHWNRICLCNTNDLLGPLPSLPFMHDHGYAQGYAGSVIAIRQGIY